MSIKVLRIIVGLFFIILGIAGVLPQVGESVFSLNNRNYTLELVFGIVEIICGIIILLGLFSATGRKIVSNASLLVFIFWMARIFLSKFIWGYTANMGMANFLNWVLILSAEAVIAASIWILARRHNWSSF